MFCPIHILKFTIQEDKLKKYSERKYLKLVSTAFVGLFPLVYRLITLYILHTLNTKIWIGFSLKNNFNWQLKLFSGLSGRYIFLLETWKLFLQNHFWYIQHVIFMKKAILVILKTHHQSVLHPEKIFNCLFSCVSKKQWSIWITNSWMWFKIKLSI